MKGNKCGHLREAPQFFEPAAYNKKLPSVLERAKCNAQQFYYNPDKWLPILSLSRSYSSRRPLRSEYREAIARVVGAILQHMDLATLEVGRVSQVGGNIVPIHIEILARYANLHLRRCQRAVNLLKKSGYLHCRLYRYQRSETWKTTTTVFKVNEVMLLHLGVKQLALQKAMHFSRKRIEIHSRSKLIATTINFKRL